MTTLPWLPHQLYVEVSSPLEVQKNLPPSHHRAHKEIVRLPLQEGTSLTVFKSRKTLPCQSWVCIKKSALYKGDVGYVESSDENTAIVLVAPHQRPYDITKQLGQKMEFCVDLVRLANLNLEPILSSAGAKIRYICSGQQFVHGLLRLSLPVHALELVEIPHLDNIKYHMNSSLNRPFIEQTLLIFSVQFWREKDKMEIRKGDLKDMTGTLGDIDLAKLTVVVVCNDHAFHCSL